MLTNIHIIHLHIMLGDGLHPGLIILPNQIPIQTIRTHS